MKRKGYSFYAGLILVLVIVFLTVLSFIYIPYPIDEMNLSNRFASPSSSHLLGTDQFGRDIFSRVLVSTRSALSVSVTSVFIGAAIGVALGSAAALLPHILEMIIMRFVDALMAFPGILSAVMLSAVLGKGIINAAIAISFFMVPVFARLSYSMILENKKRLYIKAAESYGAHGIRLVALYMLPDILSRLITQLSSSIGLAILTESSLSFLGLGIQPPGASLGLMLAEAKGYVLLEPYQALWPGVVLVIAVLGFSLLGDGISEFFIKRGDDE